MLFVDRKLETAYLAQTKLRPVGWVSLATVLVLTIAISLSIFPANKKASASVDSFVQIVGPLAAAVSLAALVVLFSGMACNKRWLHQRVYFATWMALLAVALNFVLTLVVEGPGPLECMQSASSELHCEALVHNGTFDSDVLVACESMAWACGYHSCAVPLTALLVAWVPLQLFVSLNILSSRVAIVFAVVGAAALAVGGLFVMKALFDLSTYSDGLAIDEQCASAFIADSTVLLSAQLLVSIFTAIATQVMQTVRRSVVTRELFFWSHSLKLRVADLHDEAHPFRPDNLRKWLVGDSRRICNEANPNTSPFWEIPAAKLRFTQKIAAGAAGVVWRAELTSESESKTDPVPVAAKQLISSMMSDDIDELAHEASVLGQLHHQNIVVFLGLCRCVPPEQEGIASVFLVQELCAGNLRDEIVRRQHRGNTTAWANTAISLAQQVISGMAYLHERGIVHRDLKPENVMLTGQGVVRIGDFGLSSQRVRRDRQHQHGQLPDGVGTVEYMAPEVMLQYFHNSCESDAIAPAVDVYAFGIMLWELLTATENVAVLHDLRQVHLVATATPQHTVSSSSLREVWEMPSLDLVPEIFNTRVRIAASTCCQFPANSRPSFAELATTFATVMAKDVIEYDASQPTGDRTADLQEPLVPSVDRTSDFRTRRGATETADDTDALARPSPIEINTMSGRCCTWWTVIWTRAKVHGRTAEAEASFVKSFYSHENFGRKKFAFFAFAACFFILTSMELSLASTVAGSWGGPLSSLSTAILFATIGGLAVPSRNSTVRHRIPCAVAVAVSLQVCVFCFSIVAEVVAFPSDVAYANISSADGVQFLPPTSATWQNGCMVAARAWRNTSVCLGNVSVTDARNISDQCYQSHSTFIDAEAVLWTQGKLGALQYAISYGIVFTKAATYPIAISLINLPARMYASLMLLPWLTSLSMVLHFALVNTDALSVTGIEMLSFTTLLLLVLYSLSIIGSIYSERSNRSLFILHVALRAQSESLMQDASFRQYRHIIETNREKFGVPSAPSKARAITLLERKTTAHD